VPYFPPKNGETSEVSVEGAGIAGAGDPPEVGVPVQPKTSEGLIASQVFCTKNGKPFVKSLRQIWDYIRNETSGVGKTFVREDKTGNSPKPDWNDPHI
jgi:hypothetical protein